MLKQRIQQKLSQKINPLQIQLIKLLELPTFKLEQRIKEELERNPVLEEGRDYTDEEINLGDDKDYDSDLKDISIDEFANQLEYPSYKLSTNNYSKDDKKEDIPFASHASFRESLISQLNLKFLTDREKAFAEYLIGNLDSDGYLRRDLEAIVDDLAFSSGIETSEEELMHVLDIVQDLEPMGVGARDLRECLMIQIRKKNANIISTDRDNAYKILRHTFDEFTKKHYDKIQRKFRLSDDDLKNALNEILKLNPKPGGTSAESYVRGADKIIPDFILDIVDGELQLSLNSKNIPELKINSSYIDIMESIQNSNKEVSKEQRDAVAFVKYKLNSAKSFIEAIKQRQNTLMFTMTAIIQLQEEYFISGDPSTLKPMILKDVAKLTNLDVSTISRVSNSKYIQTWFGIFSLKEFFTGSMQTESGEEVSTNEVKNALQEIVDNEDKSRPYTDDELVNLLNKQNYKIARRTIAKYRDQLNIPVARLRKEF